MNDWLQILDARLRTEAAMVRVVVATVRGSAPREPGACMLVGAEHVDGTIGGGQLEFKAIEIARRMLEQPAAPTRLDRFALGATLGQCCGGAVNLWFERYDAADLEFVAAALCAQRGGEAAVIVALPQASGKVSRTVHISCARFSAIDDTQRAAIVPAIGALLTAPVDSPRAVLSRIGKQEALLERVDLRRLPLWIFGAGHVGRALVDVLAALPFQVTWIDSREDAFPATTPANVIVRHAVDPATLADAAPPSSYFLVMTHSHGLDYEICRAILRRGDFAWAGLIGSETKAACFCLRFGREGIPPEHVARLVSPIGIAGIGSKLPGAIAIAVAAQLLQITHAGQQCSSIPVAPFVGLRAS